MTKNLKIGCRIEYAGHRGTVKFIGKIENLQGDWLGVDWDDISRGKHGGSHNGIQYFETKYPTSGSFIRPGSTINYGCSLMDAVHERYDQQISQPMQEEKIDVKVVEYVGMEKIIRRRRKLSQISAFILEGMHASFAGDALDQIASCRELDLTNNLLSDWSEIWKILASLQNVTELHLGKNKLLFYEKSEVPQEFPIEILFLNDCDLQINSISAIFRHFPTLSELNLSSNSLSSLTFLAEGKFDSLTSLDLSLNPLENWNEVELLANLKNLKYLNLTSIGLKSIKFHASNDIGFTSLETLILNDNEISDWPSITELSKLPSLKILMFLANPLKSVEKSEDNFRMIMISKLQKLRYLNREEITRRIRTDADIFYLKKYVADWQDAQKAGTREQFFQIHPNYRELIEEYDDTFLIGQQEQDHCLKSSMIEILLKHDGQVIKKTIQTSISIRQLKVVAARAFRKNVQMVQLYTQNPDDKDNIYPGYRLDNDLRDLSYYSLENGDIIIVHYNPHFRAKARKIK